MSAMKARYEEFMFACKVVPEEPNTFTPSFAVATANQCDKIRGANDLSTYAPPERYKGPGKVRSTPRTIP